jgi:uncharacterized RDD family membrane protein YckC
MTTPQAYRGEALGLPEAGPASLASSGPRAAALVIDGIASILIAALVVQIFHHGHGHDLTSRLPKSWSLIPFALDYVLGMLLAGRTVGMHLFGLRIIRVDDQTQPVNPWRAVLRTFLLMLFVPAVVWDKDGRGLHDRYSHTAVVRS